MQRINEGFRESTTTTTTDDKSNNNLKHSHLQFTVIYLYDIAYKSKETWISKKSINKQLYERNH